MTTQRHIKNQSIVSNKRATKEKTNLLEQAIVATKQTERPQTEALLRVLTEKALDGTVIWNRNIALTIKSAIQSIDAIISEQLATIMHHEKFCKLEASWRGLHHLVKNSNTSNHLKIKIINLKKRELFKDLDRAVEFDQSQLFKKIYENEFGMPGGEPYGALIGDYEFSNHPEDIDILNNMAGIAASAFCPFLTAAQASLMGFDNWSELTKPRDLEKIFDSIEYAKWRSFRENPDARFIVLALPRVLARLPYGTNSKRIEEFDFEETSSKKLTTLEHENYCWMNAAYVLGERLTHAFHEHGWCTTIRGAEGGGKVTNLPLHLFKSDDGDIDAKCPSEVGITDRREAELSKLGFLPLCHYKNTDYAVFFGAETAQRAITYDTPEATANAMISARLPYVMATSRFAHYLKVMARDKIGAFMEIDDVEAWLNRWILRYVNGNASTKQDLKAKYPLAEARVEVKEIPGRPGSYQAIVWLRPWLQMEELTTSMRLVARIPSLMNN